MSGFGIEDVVEDAQQTDDWRDEIDDNFIKTFVRYSRANQVSNEEQAVISFYGYVSGLLPNWEDYLGTLIRGGTSSGKSHMKREVLDSAFDFADNSYDWLYTATAGSDQSMINDEDFDDARIGAFNEFNQMPNPLREFLKRIVEDGGYTYGRSKADDDAEGGFTNEKFSRDPMAIVFSIADENETVVDPEMRSRMVEIQVDEGPAKNKAVHRMKHGHTNITLPDSDHEYVYESTDLDYAVKKHIKEIPVDTDVVIPTGEGRFDGDVGDSQSESAHESEDSTTPRDDWDEADVTEPLFNFARSESTRASAAVSSMVKASALANYHSRETITENGEQYIVAEPQDVGNVLLARRTLMALTHNLTRKKFLVLKAFIEDGAPYESPDASAQAKQMTKDGVITYIQGRDDIPTFSKSQITSILDELDEDLVINKMDHPEDARKNIYVYDPSKQFKPPNIYDYYDRFKDVTDPVRDQAIETTIEQQLAELNATMTGGEMADPKIEDTVSANDSDNDEEGLSAFEDSDSESDTELSETAQHVAERLESTMDGKWVPARVLDSDDLVVTHMLGITPVGTVDTTLADGTVVDAVIPKRDPQYEDRDGTLASPDHDHWNDDMTVDAVNDELDSAIRELQQAGVFIVETDAAGNGRFEINLP